MLPENDDPRWWEVPAGELEWRTDLTKFFTPDKPVGRAVVARGQSRLVRPLGGRPTLLEFSHIRDVPPAKQQLMVQKLIRAGGWLGKPSECPLGQFQTLAHWVWWSAVVCELKDVILDIKGAEAGVESARRGLLARRPGGAFELGDHLDEAVDYAESDIGRPSTQLTIPIPRGAESTPRLLGRAAREAVKAAIETQLVDGISVSISSHLAFVPKNLLSSLYLELALDLVGRPSPVAAKACEQCGRGLMGGRSDRRFCGPACKEKFYYHQKKGAAR